MNFVIFGLTISSSWGNGHATLWRGLCRALGEDHTITFFERDAPYYASSRDNWEMPGNLIIYSGWRGIEEQARGALDVADVAIITSYCPDAVAATDLLRESAAFKIFYDLDTPVTLAALRRGEHVFYIGPRGLADFDLVLSYTGGTALTLISEELNARRVAPLYGHADPLVHRKVAAEEAFRSDLSYLGTYAADRQTALEDLFVTSARLRTEKRFVIGGAQYPTDFPWSGNIHFVRHLPPGSHPAFYSSSQITLNVTRRDMATMGWCPSGRLFEAAACGTPIISDTWEGIDRFFEPGREILVARSTNDVLSALDRDPAELAAIGARARCRLLHQHSSVHRARELLGLLDDPTLREAARFAAMEA